MLRKIFSIFGLVAIVAFFLPWLKGCEKVESGFDILLVNSLHDLSFSSISSFNTGILFLFVPVYAIAVAWLSKIEKAVKPLHATFGVLAFLNMWSIGLWGGIEISSFFQEWGTPSHVHSILMAKLSVIQLLGAAILSLFILNWLRHKNFNFGWSAAVLIFPLFAVVGFGFSMEPRYYGIWMYLLSMALLNVGALIDGIWGNKKGANLGSAPF